MPPRRDKPQLYPVMLPALPSNIFNGKDLVHKLLSVSLLLLTCPVADDKLASYAYSTVMMGLITVLLFEGTSIAATRLVIEP